MHVDLPCLAAPWLGEIGRTVGMDETGLVLGHGTCLARLSQDGSLELESDRDRALALLSLAGRQIASPDALKSIEAATADWRRGEKALANLRLVFAGLPRLDGPADAWRLRIAEILLDNGLSPRALMDELGLDPCPVDLGKFGFSPNQPRVPAGNGRESGRWEAFWSRVIAWLEEPVPEYDLDTGTEVGTRSRARAIATNPITIIAAGAAALAGGELLAAGALAEPVTIADVAAALPEGMTPAMLGRMIGFSQGLEASSQASTAATAEVIAKLQSAGVTSRAISLMQRFYSETASRTPANVSAIQRASLLTNILRGYKRWNPR